MNKNNCARKSIRAINMLLWEATHGIPMGDTPLWEKPWRLDPETNKPKNP